MQDCRIHVTSVLCLLFTFVFLKKWWSQRPLGKPLLQNMFFHGFGFKKKGCKVLQVTLFCGRPCLENGKVLEGFDLKQTGCRLLPITLFWGRPFLEKKSFPRFWLKKIQLSAVTPLSGHTASANPRFWFKKVLV